jgi:hypothetical protein
VRLEHLDAGRGNVFANGVGVVPNDLVHDRAAVLGQAGPDEVV